MFDGKDIFVRVDDKPKPGFSVGVLLNRKPVKGEVGLEIEIEGKRLPKEGLPAEWAYHPDGSLRGEDNGEYVLVKPLPFKDIPKALDDLWEIFTAKKTSFDESNRTSVHVHLNCQDFHLNRLTSFSALYFIFEEVLTAWCGDHRVGNLFTLRGVDAPAIITQLKKFIKRDCAYELSQNTLHYSGFNIAALSKFGSIEIRSMRGCSDPQLIKEWVAILNKLYILSAEYPDPRDIPALLSANGPLLFFEHMLGDYANILQNGAGMTSSQIADAMYTGVRLAQDLCYCRDWDLYRAMAMKPDPFNRSSKQVAQKLMNMEEYIPDYPPEEAYASAPPMSGFGGASVYSSTPQNTASTFWVEPDLDNLPIPE